jgi:hypothetical protein
LVFLNAEQFEEKRLSGKGIYSCSDKKCVRAVPIKLDSLELSPESVFQAVKSEVTKNPSRFYIGRVLDRTLERELSVPLPDLV